MSKLRIAFLGLGTMGMGMTRRLLAHDFPLTVFNRNPEKAALLAASGARTAATPREAAAAAEVIVSMVADDQASRAIWLGPDGALAGATPGTVCVESSTLSVDWVRALAAEVAGRGCDLVDAPVTGSKLQAAAGELNFLAGGAAEAVEKVRPVLAAMGQKVFVIGPTGSGALLKLINNFLSGVQAASLAEALVLMERSGLDRARALEVLTNGAPGSPMVKTLAARMSAGDYTPNFLLRLMAKDLGYACTEAGKVAVELLTGAAALEEFRRAVAAGHGAQDMSAIQESIRQRT